MEQARPCPVTLAAQVPRTPTDLGGQLTMECLGDPGVLQIAIDRKGTTCQFVGDEIKTLGSSITVGLSTRTRSSEVKRRGSYLVNRFRGLKPADGPSPQG